MTDFHAVDANLRQCFRALASGRPHAEIRSVGGLHIVSLGVRFRMFNAAYLAFPVENEMDFERRIALASVHFGARGLDWSLWLCESLVPEALTRKAERVLMRSGLEMATQMPGMAAARLQPLRHPLPSCDVRAVDTPQTLRDFCDVGSSCFRVPPEWFNEVFDEGALTRVPFRAWVGYLDGQPVATAATLVDDGVLGIYNVATIFDQRRRGFGEYLLRETAAREFAIHGDIPLVLQSTPSGLSLYERMGFKAVTRFRVWVS